MPNLNDFLTKLDHVAEAAKAAKKELPPDLPPRMQRICDALLSRLPEQIDDIKATIQTPDRNYARLEDQRRRRDFGM